MANASGRTAAASRAFSSSNANMISTVLDVMRDRNSLMPVRRQPRNLRGKVKYSRSRSNPSNTRCPPDPRQQRVGVFPVRLHVTTDDLEIDRCGHAEIEDLADHVGRQEGERGAWEHARQPLAHGSDVVGRRRVVRLEADEDVGVLDADRPRVVVSHVDTADAQPDVVDDAVQLIAGDNLVDRLTNPIRKPGGLLDARAGLRPHMHLDLAAVDAWKEILTQERSKPERKQAEADESGNQLAAIA